MPSTRLSEAPRSKEEVMEKKLEVKDLRISFKTSNGKVQAVRGIDFDLYKGETLAIVGESGSGKSVTSRAIMGILAGNAIVESGKILYGDKDLLKISEEDFHHLRGDKIAMVFQDPLSSLNPIMRVGAQLIEAMLLKNKAARKEGARNMKRMFESLETLMDKAGCEGSKADLEKFKHFELKHCELHSQYTNAYASAQEAAALSAHLALAVSKNAVKNLSQDIAQLIRACKESVSHFVVRDKSEKLNNLIEALKTNTGAYQKKDQQGIDSLVKALKDIAAIENEALGFTAPNNFTLGYYLSYVKDEIPNLPVKELNELTHRTVETDFMNAFMAKLQKAVEYSCRQTDEARTRTSALLKEKAKSLTRDMDEKTVRAMFKDLKEQVLTCLDPLEVDKDSLTHTFGSSVDYALDLYYNGEKRNRAEQRRFAREDAKHSRIIARGKVPEWEVIPASYIDLDLAFGEITGTMTEIAAHFDAQVGGNRNANFAARTERIVDYLKDSAQQSVFKLSKGSAREKAIKLMESVGIDEPRRRYRQYPFEFSGGMRQRIVIAIALTADPDVLICDEPTTALDVTIQAQILELINKLKKERNLSVIFITHDLGVVANMADRIAVMYAGKIVEYGTADEVFYSPAHPYTWALLSSVPDLDTKEKLESIPGTPPNMIYPPKGDAFAPRNKYALEIDFEEQPPMFKITDTHYAATWLLHPDAPKMEMPAVVTERINRMKQKGGAR